MQAKTGKEMDMEYNVIYRDALGRPEANATISVFGGSYCAAYYALTSASDCPSAEWSIDTTPEQIIAEMGSRGWQCTLREDGYGRPVIKCIHAATQAVIDADRTAQSARFAGAERGYIRFGELPENGRSLNHRDNVLEAGVSCFEAEFAADGGYRLFLTPVLEVSYWSVADRQAYRLYGEVVGTGADGEPVMSVSRAVKL